MKPTCVQVFSAAGTLGMDGACGGGALKPTGGECSGALKPNSVFAAGEADAFGVGVGAALKPIGTHASSAAGALAPESNFACNRSHASMNDASFAAASLLELSSRIAVSIIARI